MYRTIYDEKRKQWSGIKARPLYNPNATIGEVLLKAMQVNGPKIAQVIFIKTEQAANETLLLKRMQVFWLTVKILIALLD